MCPTTLGRIETRVATITLPAIFATVLTLVQWRPSWIALIGLYLLLGVALDVFVYSWLFRYQPPWMTFALAVAEFGLLYVLVVVLDDIDLSLTETIAVYWVSWLLAIWTKIVLLPIFSLTYLESAGEFRRPEWSIPPQQEVLPIIAAVAGVGAVAMGAAAPAAPPPTAQPAGQRGEVPEPVPGPIERELEATGASASGLPAFHPEAPQRRRGSAARRGWMMAYSYVLVTATIAAEIAYFVST
jgi:hypothetical protein